MRKINVFLSVALVCALAATVLCACNKKEENVKKPPVSAYKSNGIYTDLGDEKLSQAGLDALPKKYAGMTPAEARNVVNAFWRYCKTALWMPDERYDIYEDEDDGTKVWKRCVEAGKVYAGLPYKGTSTGNIYRLLDFMDPQTGVVDVSEAGANVLTFGGMCSSGCYWAWARVMNSADYRWCNDSVYSRGYLLVGPYTYNLNITKLVNDSSHDGTDDICAQNGEQIMFQSYANMDIADGLIAVWEKNGHTMMCSVKPHVVYESDGVTINGEDSYLCVTEQGGHWDPGVSPNGIHYEYEYSLDKKFTFRKLFESCYIPFTFGELIGTDPVEETEIKFSHTGETITEKQLFSAKITCNYHISDAYVYVYDKDGNEIYKHAVRVRVPSTTELKIHKQVGHVYTWGDWENVSDGDTVKVEVQLGTGERPTVYEGKLAFES